MNLLQEFRQWDAGCICGMAVKIKASNIGYEPGDPDILSAL